MSRSEQNEGVKDEKVAKKREGNFGKKKKKLNKELSRKQGKKEKIGLRIEMVSFLLFFLKVYCACIKS